MLDAATKDAQKLCDDVERVLTEHARKGPRSKSVSLEAAPPPAEQKGKGRVQDLSESLDEDGDDDDDSFDAEAHLHKKQALQARLREARLVLHRV